MGAEVLHVVARRAKDVGEGLFHLEPGMIAGNRNPHVPYYAA
jgi:hypothetical protein